MAKAIAMFTGAVVCLIGFFVCLFVMFRTPSASSKQIEETVEEAVEEAVETPQMSAEESSIYEEADSEIQRFKREYGVDISTEAMVEQVRIRRKYEEMYPGKTYDLEGVFLVNDETVEESDEGMSEITVMYDEIEQYVEMYNIDTADYAGISVKEMLERIREEYGPLDDMATSAAEPEEEPAEEDEKMETSLGETLEGTEQPEESKTTPEVIENEEN